MGDGAYRLWQQWQQMHYPRRGLPADEVARTRLVTLDGAAGTILDRYFCRGPRAKTVDAGALDVLRHCRSALDRRELSADASRYFGRLQQLIEFVLADVALQEPTQPVRSIEPLTIPDRG